MKHPWPRGPINEAQSRTAWLGIGVPCCTILFVYVLDSSDYIGPGIALFHDDCLDNFLSSPWHLFWACAASCVTITATSIALFLVCMISMVPTCISHMHMQACYKPFAIFLKKCALQRAKTSISITTNRLNTKGSHFTHWLDLWLLPLSSYSGKRS